MCIRDRLGSKIKDGDRVVIIEDVTTSGKSIEETFPYRLEDNPSYLNFPGDGRTVLYLSLIHISLQQHHQLSRTAGMGIYGCGSCGTT